MQSSLLPRTKFGDAAMTRNEKKVDDFNGLLSLHHLLLLLDMYFVLVLTENIASHL
jgi:hypothetical protein